MVPSAAIAWYRYHRYPLFQIFPVIILEPVSQRFLKAPLKQITAVLYFSPQILVEIWSFFTLAGQIPIGEPRSIAILAIGLITQLGISGTN